MKTDKQLLREGQYIEALGDNYIAKSISVMIFKDKVYDRYVKDEDGNDASFYSREEAKEFVKDIELKENEFFWFDNVNNDWIWRY